MVCQRRSPLSSSVRHEEQFGERKHKTNALFHPLKIGGFLREPPILNNKVFYTVNAGLKGRVAKYFQRQIITLIIWRGPGCCGF